MCLFDHLEARENDRLHCVLMSHLTGIILITDAIAAMGLGSGIHQLGTMTVQVKGRTARLSGVQTLAGRYSDKQCTCWSPQTLCACTVTI